jgi:8-oxo-dGTP diphosphatase
MPKKYSDEEYYKSLPKKQVGTAVLFFNEAGELLILKPDYKDSWLVPGGSADEDESPLNCALRETKEEIGVDRNDIRLVGVYYAPAAGLHSDSLKFLFYGGVLSQKEISEIVLQLDEIEEFRFVSIDEALSLVSGSLKASIPMCIPAIEKHTVAYKEA